MPSPPRNDRKLDPENNPKHRPGFQWEEGGIKYKRAIHKDGTPAGCMRYNYQGKWVLCQDPTLPPSPKSLQLARKALREGSTPFEKDIPLQDRIRLQLRASAHKRDGDAGALRLTSTLPGIQALSFVTRHLEGGRTRFVELVQLAAMNQVPVAQRWYAVYADLDLNGRMHCSFDDVCAAAGVTPAEIMGLLVTTGMQQGIDVGNLVAAGLHPDLVKISGDSAKRIVGEYANIALEDRRMQFLHHNFIPAPRGTVVNVSANAQAAAAASAEPTVPNFAADVRVEQPKMPEFLKNHQPKALTGNVSEGHLIAPDPEE